MKQRTLAMMTGFEQYTRKTRRAIFLEEMEQVTELHRKSLIRLMKALQIHGSLLALILVYAAAGLPIAIFVLGSFMHDVPRELRDAARVDGASEYRILFQIIMPLLR